MPGRFLFSASNLARGESTKDPVGIFGCRRGFRLESDKRPRDIEPCDRASLIIAWRRNWYGPRRV